MTETSQPQPTAIDDAHEIKRILLRAYDNHPERDRGWRNYKAYGDMNRLLAQGKLLCDEIGYRQGTWDDIPPADQAELTRNLLDRGTYGEILDELCDGSGIYVPIVGKYINMAHLVGRHPQIAQFEGCDTDFQDNFSQAMFDDNEWRLRLDEMFPKNCNPKLLTPSHMDQIAVHGALKPDDMQRLEDFAFTYKGIDRPHLVVSDVTLDKDRKPKLTNTHFL